MRNKKFQFYKPVELKEFEKGNIDGKQISRYMFYLNIYNIAYFFMLYMSPVFFVVTTLLGVVLSNGETEFLPYTVILGGIPVAIASWYINVKVPRSEKVREALNCAYLVQIAPDKKPFSFCDTYEYICATKEWQTNKKKNRL